MKFSCFLIVFFLYLVQSECCFITNCPPAKRSALRDTEARECMRCGPDSSGHCFGPNICCGSSFGCVMSNPFTSVCRAEDQIPVPCKVPGKKCGLSGTCASSSVCCSTDGCSIDPSCRSSGLQFPQNFAQMRDN